MPPSVVDWVPEDHLVWTVLEAVGELDLSAFYAAYRADGHGRPAYEPAMMVSLLLYSYARGNRSSRRIERACVEDVAYRVVACNLVPDHSTIAEFRCRHEAALADLFSGVLGMCAKAGLVAVGVVAIDGTKIAANASKDANRNYEQIARDILEEAAEIDRREDELYGGARGDELPEHLRTREGRREALRKAKLELERERAAAEEHDGDGPGPGTDRGAVIELDPERFVTRNHGRRNWSREARRLVDERRAKQARPIARSRTGRLAEAKRRLEEDHRVGLEANAAYDAWRARGRMSDGRRLGRPPRQGRYVPPETPEGTINTTDHDSRIVRTQGQPAVQGYNAQAAVNENQIVIAAEVTIDSPDFGHLEPMVDAAERELEQAGVEPPEVVVADAGYWHKRQMENVVGRGIQVLVAPDGGLREGPRPGWTGGLYDFMRRVLATDHGKALYLKRQATVEPVFGQIKFNRGITRFQRRGRSACRSEWRLVTATHNLLKLHNHQIAAARA